MGSFASFPPTEALYQMLVQFTFPYQRYVIVWHYFTLFPYEMQCKHRGVDRIVKNLLKYHVNLVRLLIKKLHMCFFFFIIR